MKKKTASPLFIFACIMILIGVGVLLYPIVGNQIAEWHRRQSVVEYQRATAEIEPETLRIRRENFQGFNEALFNRQEGLATELVPYNDIAGGDTQVMGTIDVPALGITSLPFYYGTSYRVLDMGLGHFELSSVPIGGENTRSVITGHSGVQNQLLFTEINRLQEGDVFFINILGERLAYEIESFEEILPFQIDRVRIRPGRDMATLLTCTPPGLNTYRLLVNGFRIPYEEAVMREVITRNLWNYERVVLGSLGLIVLLFMICLLRYRNLRKWSEQTFDLARAEKATKKAKGLILAIKILFVLLFISTLVVLVVSAYGYMQMQRPAQLGVMNIGPEGNIANYHLSKINNANYEESQIASVNIANFAEAKAQTWTTVNNYGIGKIMLPDSNIDLPILAGMANINLLTGGATYRINQRLGRDNYVLLAHSIYGNTEVLFQPLYNTRIGENIYVTDFLNVYVYEVTVNEVIHDTQVEVVAHLEEGEVPIITLLRCEGNIGTRYRRLVQGKFVGSFAIDESQMDNFSLVTQGTGETGGETIEGIPALLPHNPVSAFDEISMRVAARMISDPIQVGLPLILLLLFPVIFLSILPSIKKK